MIARSKLILLDIGLAARLINVSAAGAGQRANPTVAGQLIETFAIGEIRRQLGWAEQPARLHHYREQSGAEVVDIVIETPDGRVAVDNSKSRPAATARPVDLRWLTALRDRLGRRFTNPASRSALEVGRIPDEITGHDGSARSAPSSLPAANSLRARSRQLWPTRPRHR